MEQPEIWIVQYYGQRETKTQEHPEVIPSRHQEYHCNNHTTKFSKVTLQSLISQSRSLIPSIANLFQRWNTEMKANCVNIVALLYLMSYKILPRCNWKLNIIHVRNNIYEILVWLTDMQCKDTQLQHVQLYVPVRNSSQELSIKVGMHEVISLFSKLYIYQ